MLRRKSDPYSINGMAARLSYGPDAPEQSGLDLLYYWRILPSA